MTVFVMTAKLRLLLEKFFHEIVLWFAEIIKRKYSRPIFENCDIVYNYKRSAYNSRLKHTRSRGGYASS